MRYRRVRLHANWGPDEETREFFNRYTTEGEYRWRDLELTASDSYDALIVFNHPTQPLAAPEKAVLFECETKSLRTEFRHAFGQWMRAAGRVYDTESHFNFPGWSVHATYAELVRHPDKRRSLSAVVSGKAWLPRQVTRLEFVRGALAALPMDHYGRDGSSGPRYRGAVHDKGEALLPYEYTYAAENCIERNYFTEKIHDAIVCECLAFYDGCPNLGEFLHHDCFIPVDASDPIGAVAVIAEAIARDEWRRRLPAIRREKRRLMTELNPLEIIWKALNGEAVLWPPPQA